MRKSFLNNLGLLFIAKIKVLNDYKRRFFPIENLDKVPTCEPTQELATGPTEQKKSKLKLRQEFIADEKDVGDYIF